MNVELKDSSEIFSCAEVREFDRRAIEEFHIPGIILMENAGRRLTEELCLFLGENLTPLPSILILAGPGNNGGDGFVMARQLQRLSYSVDVVAIGKPESWTGDAKINLNALKQLTDHRLNLCFFEKDSFEDSMTQLQLLLKKADVIVDAILGTGAHGAPRFPIDRIIEEINSSKKPVFAVDIPSGLNGDLGTAESTAVRAQITCTLAALKKGLLSESAAEYVGSLKLGDIGVAVSKLTGKSY